MVGNVLQIIIVRYAKLVSSWDKIKVWAHKCWQRPKVTSGAMSSSADSTSQRYLRHRPQPVGKSKVAVRLFNRFSKRKKGSICGNTNFCIFTILAFFFQNGETHHILFKKAYSVAGKFFHDKFSLLLLLAGRGEVYHFGRWGRGN